MFSVGVSTQTQKGCLQVCQPSVDFRIARHAPIPARGKRNRSDLGAIRYAGAFELGHEEAFEEDDQRGTDFFMGIRAIELCLIGKEQYPFWFGS